MTLFVCVRVDIDRNLLKDGFCKFSLTSTNSCSLVLQR
jgi:hypothetical protein